MKKEPITLTSMTYGRVKRLENAKYHELAKPMDFRSWKHHNVVIFNAGIVAILEGLNSGQVYVERLFKEIPNHQPILVYAFCDGEFLSVTRYAAD